MRFKVFSIVRRFFEARVERVAQGVTHSADLLRELLVFLLELPDAPLQFKLGLADGIVCVFVKRQTFLERLDPAFERLEGIGFFWFHWIY